MSYALEDITPEDQEKIIQDFSSDPKLKQLFELKKEWNHFPEVWAIDRKRNCYLLIEPIIGRPEIDGWPYIFFGGSLPYRIASEHTRSNKFYFRKKPEFLTEEGAKVKEEIKLAFSVFGRWGMGELNHLGKPEFRAVPEFMIEAPLLNI